MSHGRYFCRGNARARPPQNRDEAATIVDRRWHDVRIRLDSVFHFHLCVAERCQDNHREPATRHVGETKPIRTNALGNPWIRYLVLHTPKRMVTQPAPSCERGLPIMLGYRQAKSEVSIYKIS